MEHLHISPFYEEDIVGLVNDIGARRVMFGSDYPHPEGVAEPVDFARRLEGLTDGQVRMIMRDNAAALFGIKV
jgi:predicted TIM-barrel fold metal-dependent hydrolase